MMQISESYNQKHSLFNTMNRFIGAVNNMDQTVMVPSLLRDVPLGGDKEEAAVRSSNGPLNCLYEGDMYSYYELLKSIRSDIEWGCRRAEERRKETQSVTAPDDEANDEDLQKLFQFHLKGLNGVLSKLTLQANTLTNRYKQEIGISSWGQ